MLQEQLLQRLGLRSDADLITHLPLRYQDDTRISMIADAVPGVAAQFEGQLRDGVLRLQPRRSLQASFHDQSGVLQLRWLHVYPGLQARIQKGDRVRIRGEVRAGYDGLEIIHPQIVSANTALPDRLTPIYPSTNGLRQDVLRKAVFAALERADLSDTLPNELRTRLGLCDFATAITLLHQPGPEIALEQLEDHSHPAWHRIKFDELLAQQLALASARAQRLGLRATALAGGGELLAGLERQLSFAPTAAQLRARAEILADMANSHPMLRLLQGDVGSGKTLVAAMAAARALDSGVQVAVMAPTEILAEQLFQKFSLWFTPQGIEPVFLSSGVGLAKRRKISAALAAGQARLAIGTQALIQDKINFHNLGLVISDEQHRFGVGQRLALSAKGASAERLPHQLSMSATPIPRTLAMAFFADMDVSVLDELPPGRTAVATRLFEKHKRAAVVQAVASAARGGEQIYWVCPLVEESEALQLQTAVDTWEDMRASLPDLRIGLMHGRLAAEEKNATMQQFRDGLLDLLVSTTVIEVGVDVANASLMVIEHAERFGLAQLHQLRGRVGRGARASRCILLYQQPLSAVARARLRAMYETNDGFEIARRDLEQRGPGELLGVRQSGLALPRFANLQADEALLEQARAAAAWMQQHHPDLASAHRRRWLPDAEQFLCG